MERVIPVEKLDPGECVQCLNPGHNGKGDSRSAWENYKRDAVLILVIMERVILSMIRGDTFHHAS